MGHDKSIDINIKWHSLPATRHKKPTAAVTPSQSAVGAYLRELREAKRPMLSQVRLAEACGLDPSYISRIEAGKRTPTRESIDTIASVLDATEAESAHLCALAGYLPATPYVVTGTDLNKLDKMLEWAKTNDPQVHRDLTMYVNLAMRFADTAGINERMNVSQTVLSSL